MNTSVPQPPARWTPLPRLSKPDFNRFRALIRERCGIRVPDNKQLLLKNRIGKRLKALGISSYKSYYDFVMSPEGVRNELEKLWSVVTTHQTYFFREPHQIDSLKNNVLPLLTGEKNNGGTIRVWSAGCSSGQEAYTLGSVILDHLDSNGNQGAQLLATDIDFEMIESSTTARYSITEKPHIPPRYWNKYFSTTDDNYITPTAQLRAAIRFRQHNLKSLSGISGKFNIIFCRNVIMYFEKDFRLELMNYFHRLLHDDGYLFLGSSESFHGLPRKFKPVRMGRTLVYRKTRGGQS